MDKTESLLRALFDFQRFAGNERLDALIRAAGDAGNDEAKAGDAGFSGADTDGAKAGNAGTGGAKAGNAGIGGAKIGNAGTRGVGAGVPLEDDEVDLNAAGEADAWRVRTGEKKKS